MQTLPYTVWVSVLSRLQANYLVMFLGLCLLAGVCGALLLTGSLLRLRARLRRRLRLYRHERQAHRLATQLAHCWELDFAQDLKRSALCADVHRSRHRYVLQPSSQAADEDAVATRLGTSDRSPGPGDEVRTAKQMIV